MAGILLFACLFVSRAHAQTEEGEPAPPPEEVPSPAVPAEYEWYQYQPGDSLGADTGLPRLPVWSFGLRAGNAGYLGELNPQQMNLFSGGFHPGIGLMATRHLSRFFETSLEFYYIGLGGGNGTRNFSGSGLEATGNITLNITRSFSGEKSLRRKLNLYAFLGTGFMLFNTEASGGTEPPAAVTSTELVLATGFTAGYRIRPSWETGLTFSYRYLNSDRVDGTASPYSGNDGYILLGLNIRYSINRASAKDEDVVARLKREMLAYMTPDSDGDGVPDYLDKDNTTAPGTVVGVGGLALDTDGDGIPDTRDADPITPPGTEVDEKGMPADRDGDGVPDYRDAEPDSGGPAIVNYQGKAVRQKEKIKTEKTSGPDSDLVRRVLAAWNLSLIRFAPGSALVEEKYYQGLSELAFMMQSQPDMRARVIGHTDPQGNLRQNEELAKRRADEVVRILSEIYGIEKKRLQAEASADRQPLSARKGADDGANRRVEIRILLNGSEIR